jgi:hypothetical protein
VNGSGGPSTPLGVNGPRGFGFVIALALLLVSCTGKISPGGVGGGNGAGGGNGGGAGGGAVACAENHNDELRLGLQQACAGCHTTGSRPFFGSLEAFENGLVWNAKYVTPGDPDKSLLVQLLEGKGPGTYKQMPTGVTFADAVASGASTVTLEQIKEWIRTLPPSAPGPIEPSAEAFNVRRLTAEEMVTSLMDQLGLTLDDFADTSSPTWQDEELTFRGGKLAVWPVDPAPGISHQYVSDARAGERFLSLGGPNTLLLRGRDKTLAPSAMQTLVQVSQAWCSLAIDKAGNKAVLRYVTLADKSATKSAEIRQNIAALHLRMLGAEASAADLDDLYALYVKLEAANTHAAWVGVCSSFVRHPQWLTF